MSSSHRPQVQRYSQCRLPTEFGVFDVIAFREEGNPYEHLAIVSGDVSGESDVLTRVHSECLTGEVLHSLKCDCREQLHLGMHHIARDGGIILYLRQEGRGIGLGNKLKAYELQQQGLDTVDANRHLGFDDDLRRYHMVKAMLDDLKVRSVVLMTNNPSKVDGLRKEGIIVTARRGHLVESHAVNRGYLETKQARMGHVFDLDEDAEELPEVAVDYDPTSLRDD